MAHFWREWDIRKIAMKINGREKWLCPSRLGGRLFGDGGQEVIDVSKANETL